MFLMTAFAFFQDSPAKSPGWTAWAPMAIIFAIFYFILIRPQMKQQKEHRGLVENLKKGDKVVTNGGIWGEIDAVEPQIVRLKINDKTKIVVSRSAISGTQPKTVETESK